MRQVGLTRAVFVTTLFKHPTSQYEPIAIGDFGRMVSFIVRPEAARLSHSIRRASMGFTLAALHAGSMHAASVIAPMMTAVAPRIAPETPGTP